MSNDKLIYLRTIDNSTIYDTIQQEVLDEIASATIPAGDMGDGTVSVPGLKFASDTDTGIYRVFSDRMGFVAGGTEIFQIDTNSLNMSFPVHGETGSESFPSYAFSGDTNTGMYRIGGDNIGFSTGGVKQIDISTTDTSFTNPILVADGTNALPGLSFVNDSDTGIYSIGADRIGFTVGGSLELDMNQTRTLLNNQLQGEFGTQLLPGLSFSSDADTGIYRIGADNLGLTAGGVKQIDISTTDTSFTNPILVGDGTNALPGLSFVSDPDSGIYRIGSDNLGITAGGVKQIDISTTDASFTNGILVADGTNLLPSMSFVSDPDSGMYLVTPNELGLSTAGVLRMCISNSFVDIASPRLRLPTNGIIDNNGNDSIEFSSSDIDIKTGGSSTALFNGSGCVLDGTLKTLDGTVTGPALTFTNDINTGIYSIGVDNLGITAGGVKQIDISTTDVSFTNGILVADGTNLLPSMSFVSDPDSGMYLVTPNELGLSTAGVLRMCISNSFVDIASPRLRLPTNGIIDNNGNDSIEFSSSDIDIKTGGSTTALFNGAGCVLDGTLKTLDGTVSAPALTFTNDINTGIYRVGADNLGVSVGGNLTLDVGASAVEVLGVLHVQGVASGSYGSASKAGGLRYSTTLAEFIYSDGTNWRTLSSKTIVS